MVCSTPITSFVLLADVPPPGLDNKTGDDLTSCTMRERASFHKQNSMAIIYGNNTRPSFSL